MAKDFPLMGKTALITGAARRIGRAIALTLAQNGADIVIHYGKSYAAAAQTAEEIRQMGRSVALIQADLHNWASAEKLGHDAIAALGNIDILINSAASFVKARYPHVSEAEYDAAFDINLKAPFALSQIIAKHMIARRQAHSDLGYANIVNMIDEAAFRPFAAFAAHSVAKAGLLALTRVQANALGPQVRVNAVCPGNVLKPDHISEPLWQSYGTRNPLQTLGSAEQVAEAVLFLVAGPSFVNGDCLMLDGGELWMSK